MDCMSFTRSESLSFKTLGPFIYLVFTMVNHGPAVLPVQLPYSGIEDVFWVTRFRALPRAPFVAIRFVTLREEGANMAGRAAGLRANQLYITKQLKHPDEVFLGPIEEYQHPNWGIPSSVPCASWEVPDKAMGHCRRVSLLASPPPV